MKSFWTYIIAAFLFVQCSDYNKILKSKDYNLKFTKAVEYYEQGDCSKALPLLEELLSLYRLTSKGEDVYYYYAKTNYCLGEYFVANYYFRSFVKTYPGSPRAEECAFLGAMCNVKNSPVWSLEQSETVNAIESLQLFMNRYPESSKRDSCESIIGSLRDKLEKKAFEGASVYYKMENYKAASVAFKNVLQDYPDTGYKEDLLFLIVKSDYLLAQNSIDKKKDDRYRESIESYLKFADAFPESTKLKEAEVYYNRAMAALGRTK